jgi:hypothetical protein
MLWLYISICAVCIGFAVEQACFFLFIDYPYRCGIAINVCTFVLTEHIHYDDSTLINIYNALFRHGQYAIRINHESHDIYIRKKYTYFMLMAIQLIGARVFFDDKWIFEIKIGWCTLLFFIYIFVMAIVLHTSIFDMLFILFITLLYMFVFVVEFVKIKRVMSIIGHDVK